jgi:hypothetical protein
MSEIPPCEKIVNPIKDLAVQKINSIFQNKLFERPIPLQEGFLFWKKITHLHHMKQHIEI